MTVEMTIADYAKERGVGTSAIRRAIKFGYRMPGVIKRTKFGNNHVLHVDTKILKKFLASNEKVT